MASALERAVETSPSANPVLARPAIHRSTAPAAAMETGKVAVRSIASGREEAGRPDSWASFETVRVVADEARRDRRAGVRPVVGPQLRQHADGTILSIADGVARCEILVADAVVLVSLPAALFADGFKVDDPFRIRMIDRNGFRTPLIERRELDPAVNEMRDATLAILNRIIERP